MKGIIVNNAYSRLNTYINQSQRLKTELDKLGAETEIITSDKIIASIDGRGNICVKILCGNGRHADVSDYSFCVYLDKDKYASRLLEKCGLRLFNTPSAIEACDDKMLTHILLAQKGVKMPPTLAGLLCYSPDEPVKQNYLDEAERLLGYPVIVKECYGSLGNQVFKADDRSALNELAERVKCKPHLFQKCVKPSIGRDLRVIAVGGKPVAAMKRISHGDFRSNVELGASAEKCEIDGEIKKICSEISKILGLDYCGIDLLFGENGSEVCEVNSNAFFGGMERVTGINVAKAYAQHICGAI